MTDSASSRSTCAAAAGAAAAGAAAVVAVLNLAGDGGTAAGLEAAEGGPKASGKAEEGGDFAPSVSHVQTPTRPTAGLQGVPPPPRTTSAMVLTKRMESTTFLGKLDPSKDVYYTVRGRSYLPSDLSRVGSGQRVDPELLGLEKGAVTPRAAEEERPGEEKPTTPVVHYLGWALPLMQKCTCEMFGTAILVSSVAFGVVKQNGNLAPFAVSSTIFALVCLFKDISGAHFNPAVSGTLYLTDPRFGLIDLIGYVCSQLIGSIVGSFIGYGIMARALDIQPLDPEMSASRQLFHEVIPSMVLIYSVLVLSFGFDTLWELTVPFVIVACILSGSLAGAMMNPAVAFGIYISNISTENTNVDIKALMVTLFGPFIGALFAFFGYILTHSYHCPVPLRFITFKGF